MSADFDTGPWTCFHCDETFTTRREAKHHFGADEAETPICKVKGAGEWALLDALRKAIDERNKAWEAMGHEDTDCMRALYAARVDHATALVREEERGYAKGLADGLALGRAEIQQKGEPK